MKRRVGRRGKNGRMEERYTGRYLGNYESQAERKEVELQKGRMEKMNGDKVKCNF